MKFARIDLTKTDYVLLSNWNYIQTPDVDQLNKIYHKYCRYKQFSSVMPIFPCQYLADDTDEVRSSNWLGFSEDNTPLTFRRDLELGDACSSKSIVFTDVELGLFSFTIVTNC